MINFFISLIENINIFSYGLLCNLFMCFFRLVNLVILLLYWVEYIMTTPPSFSEGEVIISLFLDKLFNASMYLLDKVWLLILTFVVTMISPYIIFFHEIRIVVSVVLTYKLRYNVVLKSRDGKHVGRYDFVITYGVPNLVRFGLILTLD